MPQFFTFIPFRRRKLPTFPPKNQPGSQSSQGSPAANGLKKSVECCSLKISDLSTMEKRWKYLGDWQAQHLLFNMRQLLSLGFPKWQDECQKCQGNTEIPGKYRSNKRSNLRVVSWSTRCIQDRKHPNDPNLSILSWGPSQSVQGHWINKWP